MLGRIESLLLSLTHQILNQKVTYPLDMNVY